MTQHTNLPPIIMDTREQIPLVFPAVFAAGAEESATRVINWAYYFARKMKMTKSADLKDETG